MLCCKFFQKKEWKNNHQNGYYTINCFRGRTRNVATDESSDDSLSDDDCEKRVLKRKRELDTPSDDSGQIIPVSADVVPDRVKISYGGESVVNDRANRRPHRKKEGRIKILPKRYVTLRPTCKSELFPFKFKVYIDVVHDLFYFKGGIGCNYHKSHPKLNAGEITSRLKTCSDKV